jgi:hypothetical protein
MKFEEKVIFKSTIADQLNVNLFINKNRLTHVKPSIYFNNSKTYMTTMESFNICFTRLGSNVGMHFVQKVSTPQSSFVKVVLQINKTKRS